MSEKTCSKCKTVKEFALFTRCKKSKDGYGSWCKSCNNKRTKDKYWADPEAMRSKDRKRHQIDYEMMLNYQQHKCAICNEQLGEKLFVDHNHSTGQVRGLLCSECNSALGYIKESRQILENMIDYLTDYPAQFIPIKRTQSCLI